MGVLFSILFKFIFTCNQSLFLLLSQIGYLFSCVELHGGVNSNNSDNNNNSMVTHMSRFACLAGGLTITNPSAFHASLSRSLRRASYSLPNPTLRSLTKLRNCFFYSHDLLARIFRSQFLQPLCFAKAAQPEKQWITVWHLTPTDTFLQNRAVFSRHFKKIMPFFFLFQLCYLGLSYHPKTTGDTMSVEI